ncbi:MAG: 50S ribosomal protein L25/general stress protein Ctc [Dokdonella sp.]|jgi:large subunit ribosomal protein L25|nr:50S ribosomal protein L25/general stress protein Ctc [Dokdonella sp.]MCB1571347.1 50S ribosomal protein L25/general stress protein Ctc [Xanthomonadales bacterium]MCB1574313.1 50S ribosomal protein L25/general stress protein Ctc [Xanthomonadales bacterium]MCB1577612.1 50S ribosomal protein L25/general stress protein Ctc [Xanthomonadales bacterium]
MAKTHELSVALRKDEGKGASRRLRRAGSVPAIVYGGGKLEPVSIQLAHKDVYLASQNEWFYSSILDLNLGGDVQKVLLRDMQRHPFKAQILHLDFLRINENEEIRVRVPLHFLNQDTSPAGKAASVIIMHEVTEVEVACLPKDLPEYIEVDLADLKVDDIIHLSQLKLPAGVQIPELKLGKEHDITVVSAKLGREEVDVQPGEGEEGGVAASGDKKDEAGDSDK